MVKVIFYNLLRSTYRINEEFVEPGTLQEIIQSILQKHPRINPKDFETCVVFYQGKPYSSFQFDTVINDKEEIIITHFVGGG